ncbi:unnamed protein product, partial [Urochloa humidicola]
GDAQGSAAATPRQQLREWQGRLRNERLGLDRRVQEVRREEKKVEKAIREAAKVR